MCVLFFKANLPNLNYQAAIAVSLILGKRSWNNRNAKELVGKMDQGMVIITVFGMLVEIGKMADVDIKINGFMVWWFVGETEAVEASFLHYKLKLVTYFIPWVVNLRTRWVFHLESHKMCNINIYRNKLEKWKVMEQLKHGKLGRLFRYLYTRHFNCTIFQEFRTNYKILRHVNRNIKSNN